MRTSPLFLAVLLTTAPNLRAQVVADGATNTLSNVTTNVTGDVTIGTNGSFTLLVLSDNALLTNSANGLIGRNITAKSNEAQLLSASARWQMGGSLFVGSNGAMNRLVVSNGALLEDNNGTFGSRIDSSNNSALVTGGGSLWSNRSELTVGSFGRDNQLIVSNGGWVANRYGYVGRQAGSSNNFVLVTGSGSVWSNAFDMYVGFNERSNRLVIEAGGLVHCASGYVGDFGNASNNEALVTGPGSLWTNRSFLTIGSQAGRNRLVVSNGAAVRSGTGVMGGSSAVSNQVVVTGAGSVWSNETFLYLGAGSVGNRADVSDGGWLTCNDGSVGSGFTANSNTVLLTDSGSGWNNLGGLFVGDGGSGNVLIASNGATVLSSNAFIGASTSLGNNNFALLTEAGTLWSNRTDLKVGNFSFGNRLVVSNGAAVFTGGDGVLGANSAARTNSALIVGSGTRWLVASNLYVGSNGGFNQLVVSNAGLVESYNGRIGFSASASNNEAVVAGTGSFWKIQQGLVVGYSGSGSRLVITNGGRVRSTEGEIGFLTASNNEVLVTGTGSSWTNVSNLQVGSLGSGNRLVISDGGEVVEQAFNVILGAGSSSLNNRIVVDGGTLRVTNAGGTAMLDVRRGTNVLNAGTIDVDRLVLTNEPQGKFEFNGGTLITRGIAITSTNAFPVFLVNGIGATPATWDVRAGVSNHVLPGNLLVGNNSALNQLLITNGAVLTNLQGIIGNTTGANSNLALLSGAGSVWSLGSALYVGIGGTANQLVVSNGAVVMAQNSFIGYNAGNDHSALVTGAGSLWSNAGTLYVCYVASGGRLVVSNGGTVFAAGGVYMGLGSSSTNNRIVVDGGTLRTTNASGNAPLNVLRGTNVLNAGLIEVDILRMTNGSLSKFEFNGGTLSAKSSRVSIGSPLIIGNGVSPATFNLAGNGTHDFSGTLGLIVSSNATLTGNGSLVVQLQVRPGAQLVPGASVGNINLSTPPSLQGAVVMELTKNGTVLDYDQIQVSGTLTYGGALIVTNLGPTALAAGDRFKLFSAGSYAGSFSTITLPPLDLGLDWTNKLSVDGSIEVIGLSVQTLPASAVGPNQATLNGVANPGGATATAWFEWGLTTNFGTVTPPRVLGSGMSNTNFSQALTGLVAGATYHFRAVASDSLVVKFGTNQSFTTQAEAGFALSFNGTSNYLQAPHNNALNFYPLTVTAWVKTTQATGEVGIVNKYVAGSSNGWQIYLLNGNVRAWYFRDSANYVSDGAQGLDGGPIANGAWHHVALVVDAASGRLYVDGALMGLLPWTGTPGSCTTTQVLSVARYPGGAGEFFRGVIDEVSIWEGARTVAEIQTFMDRGLTGGGSGIPGEYGLIVYYRLPEGAGTFSNDNAPAEGNSFAVLPAGGTWVPGVMLRPALVTKPAAAVTTVSAALKSVVNPGHAHTTTWFEWGTTTNYGNVTPVQALGNGANNTNVSQALSGLTEGALYHFRGVASNLLGASYGDDRSFVTTGTNMLTPRAEHTATLLPNGKVLVAGGSDENYVPISAADLYDPATGTWAATSPMSAARHGHSATLLPNGKVLVAGGQGVYPALFASAELFDPATGTWTPTGAMSTNRYRHTATLLTSGKVLVTAGENLFGRLSSSELYDPVSGSWTTTGPLAQSRTYHTATLLPDGKVLVAGGETGITNNVTLSSAELYDPVSGMWTNTGSMSTNRASFTATLLRSGKVMVVGGNSGTTFLGSAELYDPITGTWTATGSMLNYRFQHTATLLPNGRVLASGLGIGAPSLYDPLTGTWTDVSGPDPGASATATLLANGKVLIAGGTYGTPTAEVELFDYAIGTWAVTAPMATARDGHTATLLPNGRVLVASFTNSELYNPITGTWSNTGALVSGRYNHTATLLPSGKVMVAGGINFSTVPGVELYDAASGFWTNTGALATNRIGGHTATLLLNGKVLVAGGNDNLFAPPIRSAELYDSATGTWTATGSMSTNRSGHSATLLPNGKVLVAGGVFESGLFPRVLSTAELYDPTTGLWTTIPPMATNRSGHIAVLLPNGKVLVAGGSPASLSLANASAELYDPATGTWKATGSMITGREGKATLLPNGKVLVAGGYSLGYLSSAELYDPATGTWTATASLGAAHNAHTSTLLPNGKVLVTGGYWGNGNTNRVELYDVGQGFSNSWRPEITAITSPLSSGGNLVITGAQFRGLSEGSSGNASQDSPSDYPLVQLRSLESGRTVFLLCTNWSTNSFTSTPVSSFPPGFAMATVFVNGIPSTGAVLNVSFPVPSVPILADSAILANGAFQFGFTNAPNSTFTVLASANVSLPLSNWTVLGGVAETSPGQYQFTDPQATNSPQRTYRVRWP